MTDTTIDARLDRLEKQNKRLKFTVHLLSLFVLVAVLVSAQGKGLKPDMQELTLKTLNVKELHAGKIRLFTTSRGKKGNLTEFETRIAPGQLDLSHRAFGHLFKVALNGTALRVSCLKEDFAEKTEGPELLGEAILKSDALFLLDSVKRRSGMLYPNRLLLMNNGVIRAVLGEDTTKSKVNGALTKHPTGTLTLYSETGDVIHQVPKKR